MKEEKELFHGFPIYIDFVYEDRYYNAKIIFVETTPYDGEIAHYYDWEESGEHFYIDTDGEIRYEEPFKVMFEVLLGGNLITRYPEM